MTNEELIKNILDIPSETRTVEFKRVGASRNDCVAKTLESIVAMANTDGGTIILGVDDPQKTTRKGLDRIFGIEENLELYDEIGKSVRKISPPIPGIWPPELIDIPNNKRVGLLFVPKVGDGFRSFEGHVHIRLEKGNKLLAPQELVHFAYVKGFERADKELVAVEFALLKTGFYESWRKKREIADDSIEVILEKTGLARKESNGQLQPTRARQCCCLRNFRMIYWIQNALFAFFNMKATRKP
ncbi:MAG: ATP-binding protein [Candidatus Izemoplasmatales bacterium]|jgi:ATP-dependent DNA helicase RecG